nr:MAG TPA: hypothetical protein [Caudoviricetes sp.]
MFITHFKFLLSFLSLVIISLILAVSIVKC